MNYQSDINRININNDYNVPYFTELLGCIRRRRLYFFACSASGFLIGLLVYRIQSPDVTFGFTINLNRGPQQITPVAQDKSPYQKSVVDNTISQIYSYKPSLAISDIRLDLEEAARGVLNLAKTTGESSVHNVKIDSADSQDLVQFQLTVPTHKEAFARTTIKSLIQKFIETNKRNEGSQVSSLPPSSSWITVSDPEYLRDYRPFSIISFSLFGCFVGILAALSADRLANRVYSSREIKELLEFPLIARFSGEHLNTLYDKFQLTALATTINPDHTWIICSILKPHPAVDSLGKYLIHQLPHVDFAICAPLLSYAALPIKNSKNLGVLIVVEPGFNSSKGLQETRRILKCIPQATCIYLIMVEPVSFAEL